MEIQVREAAEIIRKGGVILYPTDTVWGIGCDATNQQAVERIYSLKRKQEKHSMIVLVESVDSIGRYVRKIPELAIDIFELTDKPLTLILPGGVGIASNLLPEDESIAIRIPKHKFCQELLRAVRRPLVSTSANIAGEQAPAMYSQIVDEILEEVDYVVDPTFEAGGTGHPSSIIKIELNGEIKIIRE